MLKAKVAFLNIKKPKTVKEGEMNNIAFGQYIGAYLGIAMLMLELIAVTLSLSALLILHLHREKVEKPLLYPAYAIYSFALIIGLYYILTSMFKSNWF